MSELAVLQHDFAAALLDADAEARLAACCAGSPGRVAAGIAAYRRSVLANLAGAVAATYPVMQRIVGAEFLAEAARCYVRKHPSRSGDLNAYGSDFDLFLTTWSPAADLPWLPAVAQLEWQVQQVYGAPDAPAVDLAVLQTLAPEHWDALRFTLDPGHAIVASRWPLACIWAVNQPGYDGDMRVDFEIAQTVLVHRRGFDVLVEALAADEVVFLQTLSAGAPLGEAVEAAIATVSGELAFDLAAVLQRFLACGLLRQAHFLES